MISENLVKAGFDTNVFNDRNFLEELLRKPPPTRSRKLQLQLYLSPIVLTELSVKLFREGWDDLAMLQYLQEFPFHLLTYSERPTFAVARLVATERISLRDHARDLMIGTNYLVERCIIVTENVKHFAWVTLKSSSIQRYVGIKELDETKGIPELVYTPKQLWNRLRPYFE